MRDILKASIKVGFATLASLLGWVVAGKIIALQLGAAGVGIYGILRQLLQNLTLVGSLNGQTALVQGISSRTEKGDQLSYSGSVLKIQIIVAGTLLIVLLISAPWLGPMLIPHPDAVALLRLLSVAMLIAVAQAFVVGVLNGHRLINELVKSQIVGPITVLILLFPMIWLVRGGHPFGLVLMLAGPGAVVTVAATWAVRRNGWFPEVKKWVIRKPDLKSFFKISSVMLVAGVITTGTQFAQSWLVAHYLSLAEAGMFWTAWTLSMTYLTLVLGSLGTYYMPSLSRLHDINERETLVRTYLHLCLFVMPVLVSSVIVIKPFVVNAMFSSALLPSLKVMRWMLIGDLFKGISWVLAFPMLAFGEMKWFFWTEVLFSAGLALTAWIWMASGGGIEGLGVLFMVLYLIYMPVMGLYIYKMHGFKFKAMEVKGFVGAVLLIVFNSALNWNKIRVDFIGLGAFIFAAFVYIYAFQRLTKWNAWSIWRNIRGGALLKGTKN